MLISKNSKFALKKLHNCIPAHKQFKTTKHTSLKTIVSTHVPSLCLQMGKTVDGHKSRPLQGKCIWSYHRESFLSSCRQSRGFGPPQCSCSCHNVCCFADVLKAFDALPVRCDNPQTWVLICNKWFARCDLDRSANNSKVLDLELFVWYQANTCIFRWRWLCLEV